MHPRLATIVGQHVKSKYRSNPYYLYNHHKAMKLMQRRMRGRRVNVETLTNVCDELNLRRADLAKKAVISVGTVDKMFAGGAMDDETLKRVCKALGTTMDELLSGVRPPRDYRQPAGDDGRSDGKVDAQMAAIKMHAFVKISDVDVNDSNRTERFRTLLESLIAFAGLQEELRVVAEIRGSVIVEVEMSEGDYERVLAAFREGRLKSLGIVDVSNVPPAAATTSEHLTRLVLDGEPIIVRPAQVPLPVPANPIDRAESTSSLAAGMQSEIAIPRPAEERDRRSVTSALAGLRHVPSFVLAAIRDSGSLMAQLIMALAGRYLRVTLIEVSVIIGICSVFFMLLLPAVQSAREKSRRAQCTNILEQLNLATQNYMSSHGCFPSGSYSGTLFNPPHVDAFPGNFSCFVRIMPFFEESRFYNAINFDLCSSDAANLTISGVQMGSLVCPSDSQNQRVALPATQASSGVTPGWRFNQIYPLPPGQWEQAFTSYAGNAGTFAFGFSNLMPPEVLRHYNGVIYNDSSVTIADITDGTSTTLLFGERSKGHTYVLDPAHAISDNTWNSGRWHDTLFATLYPLNLAAGNGAGLPKSGVYYGSAAGSYHPTGANVAFCDGSVKFIKNSISSWGFRTGNRNSSGDSIPDRTTYVVVGASAPYTQPGSYLQVHFGASMGIYQMLSTRNGSEVISQDSY